MGNSIQKYAFLPHTPTELENPIFIKSKKCRIPVLHYPAKTKSKVIIFSHGNASDLGDMQSYLELLNKALDVDVVGYEYIGYGYSQVCKNSYSTSICSKKSPKWEAGVPSEEGCYESLLLTYKWVKSHLGFAEEDIILMGQSIGSGPVCEIASKNPCGGVILITPFRSAVKVVTDSAIGYFVDFFQNENKICNIDAPILIIHGTMDEVVEPSHAKHLNQLLDDADHNHTMVWVDMATHNDIMHFKECCNGIATFVDNLKFSPLI